MVKSTKIRKDRSSSAAIKQTQSDPSPILEYEIACNVSSNASSSQPLIHVYSKSPRVSDKSNSRTVKSKRKRRKGRELTTTSHSSSSEDSDTNNEKPLYSIRKGDFGLFVQDRSLESASHINLNYEAPLIGQILGLQLDSTKDEDLFRVRWFACYSELIENQSTIRICDGTRELFWTDHIDIVPIESLKSKVSVSFIPFNSDGTTQEEKEFFAFRWLCVLSGEVVKLSRDLISLAKSGTTESLDPRSNAREDYEREFRKQRKGRKRIGEPREAYLSGSENSSLDGGRDFEDYDPKEERKRIRIQRQHELMRRNRTIGKSNDEKKYKVSYQFMLAPGNDSSNDDGGNIVNEFDEASRLLCRDEEKATLESFIGAAVRGEESASRCLYISGVPGTGKTATVREVLKYFRYQSYLGECSKFSALELNGMNLRAPTDVYCALVEKLKNDGAPLGKMALTMGATEASAALSRYFSAPSNPSAMRGKAYGAAAATAAARRRAVILILDELDALVVRGQDVLYTLSTWTTLKGSRLVMIGIANTMDLPERTLARTASRMGLHRLVFSPYTATQLVTILKQQIPQLIRKSVESLKRENEKMSIRFDDMAVELAARKVAVVSGDMRRAMEVCTKATEIALKRNAPAVSPSTNDQAVTARRRGQKKTKASGSTEIVVCANDVNEAMSDTAGSGQLIALSSLSVSEILVVLAIAVVTRQRGSFGGAITLLDVYNKIGDILASLTQQAAFRVHPRQETTQDETPSRAVACDAKYDDPMFLIQHAKARLSHESVLQTASLLASRRILLLEQNMSAQMHSVVLNIEVDDMAFVLRDQPELASQLAVAS
uniref:Origin recognition complex subunit 1 n=1 Tax=Timspurckia oligopyrenoides TaxID=708627 RepID=A0A7S0ZI60_9RHOD|mmetsp:Transcript_6286/g.11189  ORF Transcript_6286/g.11189 Transcript_6286/m.11189 type:complete len:834 (+) Transcript_6286:58-2559(+)